MGGCGSHCNEEGAGDIHSKAVATIHAYILHLRLHLLVGLLSAKQLLPHQLDIDTFQQLALSLACAVLCGCERWSRAGNTDWQSRDVQFEILQTLCHLVNSIVLWQLWLLSVAGHLLGVLEQLLLITPTHHGRLVV